MKKLRSISKGRKEMKEITQYQCELCKTLYDSEEKAITCEQSHKTIIASEPCKYKSFESNPEGYPSKIMVTFNDGRKIIYDKDYRVSN